jgi:hypothetical protein
MWARLWFFGVSTWGLLILSCLPLAMWAQASMVTLGGKGTVNPLILKEISTHNVLLGGTFGGELRIGDAVRESRGGQDVFLSLWQEGQLLWLQSFGGPDSEILAVEPGGQPGEILVFIVFWGQIDLGDTLLVNPLGGQALLSLKLSEAQGQVLDWWMLASDGGVQQVQHCPSGPNRGFVSFRLEGRLFSPEGDLLLEAQRSLVLMEYQGDSLALLEEMPLVGNVALTSMVLADSVLYGVGHFNGRISAGQTSIATVSIYEDGFSFRYALQGSPLLLQRYGGIFDNQLMQAFVFQDGVYFGGHFSGVLQLSEQLGLESNGFASDWVLLGLDALGRVERFWQSSSSSTELFFSAQAQGERLYLGLQYLGQMQWEGGALVCDPQGFASAVLTLEGESLALDQSFCFSGNTNNPLYLSSGEWVYRVFTNDRDFSFMGADYLVEGVNDGYLWREFSTDAKEVADRQVGLPLRVFPNPSGREATLVSEGAWDWRLLDARGARVSAGRSAAGEKQGLRFPGPGVYYLLPLGSGEPGAEPAAAGQPVGRVWRQIVVE